MTDSDAPNLEPRSPLSLGQLPTVLPSSEPSPAPSRDPSVCDQPPRDVPLPARLEPGRMLDIFRIEQPIGRGGMGEVWKAWDTVAERSVVIKVLPPEFQGQLDELARVRDTFQRVHALQHQHICPVYLLGNTPGVGYFVVMKYVEGITLSAYRREYVKQHSSMPLAEVVRLLQPVARALDYAHGQKVVHRDIKPQNILVRRDGSDVQLIDFGLAAEIRTSMTRVSRVRMDSSGTLPYMAPEQWRGQYQDARTDQYALAVVAYELLAGRLPFEAPDEFVLRECVLGEPVPPIEDQPSELNAVLARALAKTRNDRFANEPEFLQALIDANESAKQTASTPKKTTRRRKTSDSKIATDSSAKPTTKQDSPTNILKPPPLPVMDDSALFSRAQKNEELAPIVQAVETAAKAKKLAPVAPEQKPPVAVVGHTSSSLVKVVMVTALVLAVSGFGYAYRQGWVYAESLRIPTKGKVFAVSPDGQQVACNHTLPPPADNSQGLIFALGTPPPDIEIYDLLTGKSRQTIDRLNRPVTSLRWTYSRKQLLIGCRPTPNPKNEPSTTDSNVQQMLRLYSLESAREVCRFLGHTDAVTSIAVQSNDEWFISGSEDKTVRRWATETGELKWNVEISSPVTSVSIKDQTVFVGTKDGWLHVLDAATGDVRNKIEVSRHPIQDVVSHMANRHVFVAAGPGEIHAIADELGTPTHRQLQGHSKEVFSLALSPDGRRLLSGGYDFTARLWDADSFSELRKFEHKGVVSQVSFTPDGRRAVCSDAHDQIIVWRLPP